MTKKSDILRELKEAGVVVNEKETIAEMKYKLKLVKESASTVQGKKCKEDPMTGLSRLRKADVQMISLELGLPVKTGKKAMGVGELLSQIRTKCEEMKDEAIGFGKHKGLGHLEVIKTKPDYVEWAIDEVNHDSHKGLRAFTMLARLYYGQPPDSKAESDEEEEARSESPKPKRPTSKGPEPKKSEKQGPGEGAKTTPRDHRNKKVSTASASSDQPKPTEKFTIHSESEYEKIPVPKAPPPTQAPQPKAPPPQWTGRESDLPAYLELVKQWKEFYGEEELMDSRSIGKRQAM